MLAVVAVVVLAAVAAYLFVEKPWAVKSVAFSSPAHSIAVLPFVNLSGDKDQEYFSDGLTEELLNSLAAIEGLQRGGAHVVLLFQGPPGHRDCGAQARWRLGAAGERAAL